MKSVGPEWFMFRSGLDWRPDDAPIETTPVQAYIIQGNSLDRDGMAERFRKLNANSETPLRPASTAIIDPTYGLDKHLDSALDTSKIENQWDSYKMTGADVASLLANSIHAGFLRRNHIAMVWHDYELTADLIKETSQHPELNATHHQTIILQKAGNSR